MDVGKAIDQDAEGSHVEFGIRVLKNTASAMYRD